LYIDREIALIFKTSFDIWVMGHKKWSGWDLNCNSPSISIAKLDRKEREHRKSWLRPGVQNPTPAHFFYSG
jgi:hypothetical protein